MLKTLVIIFIISSSALQLCSQVNQDWVARYNGPLSASSQDIPTAITTDNLGNIYITGTTYTLFTNHDFYTIKYNSAGIKQWEKTYNDAWNFEDYAMSVAVDKYGNVYVTGSSENSQGQQSDDFLTIKYNSYGDSVWVRRYNGPGNYIDDPAGVLADTIGNIFVAGSSFRNPGNFEYCIIKYNQQGNQIWVARYGIPPGYYDVPVAFKVDNQGNTYITGYSDSSQSGNYCYLTEKFNSQGNFVWKIKYHGPVSYDYPRAIAIDGDGSVYVTGLSAAVFDYYSYDYATVKYNSSGQQIWVQRYNGPGNAKDIAYSIGVDQYKNVFVTGYSVGENTNFDIATIKYDSTGIQKWINRYNSSNNDTDKAFSLSLDNAGNVYVTGQTKNPGHSFDFITFKLDNNGNNLWSQTYNGTGDSIDISNLTAIDNNNNLIVAGQSFGYQTDVDYEIIKYSSGGSYLWGQRQNGVSYNPSDDICNKMELDKYGSIYLIGKSQSIQNGYDFMVIKYNNSGSIQWVSRLNGTGNSDDEAKSIAMDSTGNIIVTGYSSGIGTNKDILTVKYRQNGDTSWTRRYNGAASLDDIPSTVKTDPAGNIYVTGLSMVTGYNSYIGSYITIKYDSTGNQLWAKTYSNNQYTDHSNDIAIDDSGYVYVTGLSNGAGGDIYTIKYDANGTEQWARRIDYNNTYQEGFKIAVDGSSNIIVCAQSSGSGFYSSSYIITFKYDKNGNLLWQKTYGSGTWTSHLPTDLHINADGSLYVLGYGDLNPSGQNDYVLLKYNGAGTQLWVSRYNGQANLDDKAYSMVQDDSGNIYVTGGSISTGTSYDFATVKFDSSGIQQWSIKYNGTFDSTDIASTVRLDRYGNLYVAGTSFGYGTQNDFALIKYNSNPIGIQTVSSGIPHYFSLSQNYPNPFNPVSIIKFEVPKDVNVTLKIFDILGREVTTLVNEFKRAGFYESKFDGNDLASGIYFYRIEAGGFISSKKMILIK